MRGYSNISSFLFAYLKNFTYLCIVIIKQKGTMNADYTKIKNDLLKFGKKYNACEMEYVHLDKAESIEDVMAVVKYNFGWCARHYEDFIKIIKKYKNLFAEYNIFANQNIEIEEGIAYLLITEKNVEVSSYSYSTINVIIRDNSIVKITSYNKSQININSYCASIVIVDSWDSSTISIRSYDMSIINGESWENSNVDAHSYDSSAINIKSRHSSMINAESRHASIIHVTSYDTSIVHIRSCDDSTIHANSYHISKIHIISYHTSTIYAKRYENSTICAHTYDNSIMFMNTDDIHCEIYDNSIVRYINENMIIIGNDPFKIEKYQ